MLTTKNTDARGRLALGERFANKQFIVTEVSPTELKVELAGVVPAREAWLYENPKALAAVRRGLAQARAGEFAAEPPDAAADQALADKLADRQ